jgi:hypothetical protein
MDISAATAIDEQKGEVGRDDAMMHEEVVDAHHPPTPAPARGMSSSLHSSLVHRWRLHTLLKAMCVIPRPSPWPTLYMALPDL